MEKRVALLGIVVEDMKSVEKLNNILHGYSEYIIGRMGLPYHAKKHQYYQYRPGRAFGCDQRAFRQAWNAERGHIQSGVLQIYG